MKMYKISNWGYSIEEIEVSRRTAKMVYIFRGGRERASSSNNFFETRDDAIKAIIGRYERNILAAETSLIHAEQELIEAKKSLGVNI